jgi:phosphotransferase system HPr-like phosphotransfer protein
MEVWLQVMLQLARLPALASVVQTLSSSQEVGQEDGGSQVSPDSITPLPQVGVQSESLLALHAAGQQPSAATQAVMMV